MLGPCEREQKEEKVWGIKFLFSFLCAVNWLNIFSGWFLFSALVFVLYMIEQFGNEETAPRPRHYRPAFSVYL
jgi:hypothetical protein